MDGLENIVDNEGDDNDDNDDLYGYLQFVRSYMTMTENNDASDAIAVAAMVNLRNATTSAVSNYRYNDSSSDEEEVSQWGGSKPGKAGNKNRDFVGAHDKLLKHYFSGIESVYNETDFERRFRMPRVVFNRIFDALVRDRVGPFVHKTICVGAKSPGIFPLCRLVACLRKLCYGDADDRQDEYLQMSETSLSISMKSFCALIVEKFGPEFLNRSPSVAEKQRCVALMSRRCFPGAFGAWDCKHFVWKNCPMYLQGQYKGHAEGGKKTTILEAVADLDCYIWHVFFGEPGSLNDINVLNKSSIVTSITTGTFDARINPYVINGNRRDWLYYLVDGIYPQWSNFVRPFQQPANDRELLFNKEQEAARKCVERAFGILVAKFHILKNPIRSWYMDDIKNILYCCIILHNMVVAERRTAYDININMEQNEEQDDIVNMTMFGFEEQHFDPTVTSALGHRMYHMQQNIENVDDHRRLTIDLMEHIHNIKNNDNNN